MKHFEDFEYHSDIQTDTKVKPMTVVPPEPRPVKHIREFDRDEIKAALIHYLKSNGVQVPLSEVQLWGLGNTMSDSPAKLTLAIIQTNTNGGFF